MLTLAEKIKVINNPPYSTHAGNFLTELFA